MIDRTLIVTDSIGAPRSEPETVTYEQSWVCKVERYLRSRGSTVFAITHNGLHSQGLRVMADSKLLLYEPTLVLLQCGIVDCAPRVMTNREVLLTKLLGVDRLAHAIASKYHAPLSRFRNMSLYSLERFSENQRSVYRLLKRSGCVTVQVPIAPACVGYVRKSPNIKAKISAYNLVLRECSDHYLDEFETEALLNVERIFMSDHHHLNAFGHELLAGAALAKLRGLANSA